MEQRSQSFFISVTLLRSFVRLFCSVKCRGHDDQRKEFEGLKIRELGGKRLFVCLSLEKEMKKEREGEIGLKEEKMKARGDDGGSNRLR